MAPDLEQQLRTELDKVRKRGFISRRQQPSELPTISALAEAETAATDDGEEAIRPFDLLSYCAGQIDSGQNRSKAAQVLYSTEVTHRQLVKEREEMAAPYLDLASGGSLRKSYKYKELQEDMLYQLLLKAEALDFRLPVETNAPDATEDSDDSEDVLVVVEPPVVTEPSQPDRPSHSKVVRQSKWRSRSRVAGAGMLVAAGLWAGYSLAFQPDGRQLYNYEACASSASKCGPRGSHAVFNSGIEVSNSFIRNDDGDERNFLTGRGAAGKVVLTIFRDPLYGVGASSGDEVTLDIYIHNNAQLASAIEPKVRVEIPSGASREHTITAFVEAENADPEQVVDTLVVGGPDEFALKYRPGSAYMDFGSASSDGPIDDSIVSGGTTIGDPLATEVLPGGFIGRINLMLDVEK